MAPVHCAAGSDGEMNFGVTSLAAPKAVSSRVARYSFTARLAVLRSRSVSHSLPGIERCLLASDIFRRVFERVVEACMAAGLVGGQGVAVDASLIVADGRGNARCWRARRLSGP